MPGAVLGDAAFEEIDQLARDVDAGGFADAFKSWIAVHFDDFWAGFGAENVDTGNV